MCYHTFIIKKKKILKEKEKKKLEHFVSSEGPLPGLGQPSSILSLWKVEGSSPGSLL